VKDSLIVALCLPVGLDAGAIGAKMRVGSSGDGAAPVRADAPHVETAAKDASAELARLSARIDELVQRVDTLADQRRAAPVASSEPAGLAALAPTVGAPTESAPVDGPVDLANDADWLVFTDPSSSLDARQAAWAKLRERGLLDEAIALAEARAAAAPDDPVAQFDLGVGYIEKIQEVGGGIEAGKWASKADDAFDRSLALDEEHLDARLYKAMSLSFWPPIFGKRAEAIAQFETLIEKQAAHPAQDHFANSYMLLGNLHMDSGDSAKALEVWKAGAAAFPQNSDLAAKVAAAGGS
jgi:tetratricopeptide (TPR) repeat protein